MKTYFFYILECVNGAYYTGYTTDMERRYREHCDGSGKWKYTRSFPPKRIAACWEIQSETASEAMKFEMAVKGLTKELKKNFIDNHENLKQLVKSDIPHQNLEYFN
jgi:putative endonuclease